ncbi:iron complex transport system permease protein [Sinobacterium caligoides]|uniref:Iron complex transport system permease protein n=1 Tax=Sinobacterium caligoides TaxID=933926 RepID=A0A3N2DLY6_9GAMM|nr:iron ABC transporter permease [Sinobacterium caligoides]ROS00345.1 iron complex transport system permease protein [Sinobacterium caligoides]
MINRLPLTTLLPLCLALMIAAVTLSITSGAMALPASQSLLAIWDSLWRTEYSNLAQYQQLVVLDLRLPRTLLALSVGAILAQCGAVMQGLFRNPLADPGIIGASSGAALGAACAIILLPVAMQGVSTPVAAFLGALLTTMLVFKLAQGESGTSVVMLLLAGVAVAAFGGAMMGFLNYIADDQSLRDITLWSMGSVAHVGDGMLLLCFVTMVLTALYFQRHAQALNAMLLGEYEARHLGVNVERMKIKLIVVTTIGIGITVAAAGIIGFIGLVIPHLVRMLTGPDHRTLLPLSAILGALLLLFADVGARLIMMPAELPVGLITAVIGAPLFTVLLIQQRKNFT